MATGGGDLVIKDFVKRRLAAMAESRLGGSGLETGISGA
jgi:hypothetical protein